MKKYIFENIEFSANFLVSPCFWRPTKWNMRTIYITVFWSLVPYPSSASGPCARLCLWLRGFSKMNLSLNFWGMDLFVKDLALLPIFHTFLPFCSLPIFSVSSSKQPVITWNIYSVSLNKCCLIHWVFPAISRHIDFHDLQGFAFSISTVFYVFKFYQSSWFVFRKENSIYLRNCCFLRNFF